MWFVHLLFLWPLHATHYFPSPRERQGKQPGSVLSGMSLMYRIAKNKYYYLKAALE